MFSIICKAFFALMHCLMCSSCQVYMYNPERVESQEQLLRSLGYNIESWGEPRYSWTDPYQRRNSGRTPYSTRNVAAYNDHGIRFSIDITVVNIGDTCYKLQLRSTSGGAQTLGAPLLFVTKKRFEDMISIVTRNPTQSYECPNRPAPVVKRWRVLKCLGFNGAQPHSVNWLHTLPEGVQDIFRFTGFAIGETILRVRVGNEICALTNVSGSTWVMRVQNDNGTYLQCDPESPPSNRPGSSRDPINLAEVA